MTNKDGNLVIVGDGEFAEIAYEYFTHDSPYTVVAFAVEKPYLKKDKLFNLPIIPLDELVDKFPEDQHRIFVAVTYTQLNRVRARLYKLIKNMRYQFATYISSHAFVWSTAEVGENCFIFENNVVQSNVKIGNNVVLWSGNHIGHRTVIHDHCYIASHAVVSGYCEIGESCFLGVNCTLADNVKIARDSIIGAGALIASDTEEAKVYPGSPAVAAKASSLRVFKVKGQ